LPSRERNRVLRANLHGGKDYYQRFIDKISGSFELDLWALIVDISRIGIKDIERFLSDLPLFTRYCKTRKIPSMISLSLEQANSLHRKDWGKLVKGFELKDLVVDCRLEGIMRLDASEVRGLVSNVNDMIMNGKRLIDYMKTHYLHSSFIMTILVDETTLKLDKNLSILRELGALDIEKFRLDKRVSGLVEKDLNRLISDNLEKSGKIFLDDADNVKGKIGIRVESIDI